MLDIKSNLRKVKVSLVREETMKNKIFWMLCNFTRWCYLCCHKQHCCHKSQCISKYLFPWKLLSFEREINNQFGVLIIAIKFPRRQIKDSWYSEAATVSQIGVLNIFVKISGKYQWKSSFWTLFQAIDL